MKKLICKEVARCQPPSLRKKLFHISSFMHFIFIFSECIMQASSEEALKVCEHNFFQRKVLLLVIYLLNHDSFKPAWCKSRTRTNGSWDSGHQSLKMGSGTRLKIKSGTLGPRAKFKSGTLIIIFLHYLIYYVLEKYI